MHKRNSKSPKWGIACPEKTYNTLIRKAIEETNYSGKDTLLGWLRSKSYERLIEWSSRQSPQLYDSASSYFDAASISSLVKKVPFPPDLVPSLDPRKAATDKYLDSELRCAVFNSHAASLAQDPVTLFARQYIEAVIGNSPDIEEILQPSMISSGACLGVHGNKTNLARKLSSERWSCTPRALPYGHAMVRMNSHFSNVLTGSFDTELGPHREAFTNRVAITHSNRVSFVPKTARVQRPIAVEPFINSVLQGCVDTFMKRRLLGRSRLNLFEQSRNQAMARQGSLGGFNPYCTIDLESASDSLSIELVRLLLPPEWYAFLDDLRSPLYQWVDGRQYKYAKFCSMGNGFCFPLETLIFSSLIYGHMMTLHGGTLPDYRKGRFTVDSEILDFSVYGDDIVVRSHVATGLMSVLSDYGLKINSEKSFIDGPFRESCGADWYLGQDVRPVVLTKWPSNENHLMALHNSFWRSSACAHWGETLQEHLRSLVPRPLMRPGKEPGDTCFSVPLDLFMSSATSRWDRDHQSFSWRESTTRLMEDKLVIGEEDFARVLNFGMLAGVQSQKPFVLRYTTKRRSTKVCRPWHDHFHGCSFSSVYETPIQLPS